MCEFCGCSVGRSVERPVRQMNVRGKALGVRIVAVDMRPKAPRASDAAQNEETRPALERAVAEYSGSSGAVTVRISPVARQRQEGAG